MNREVRRVPVNWKHPKDEKSEFISLFQGSFSEKLNVYKEEACQWALGNQRNFDLNGPDFIPRDASTDGMTFEEWSGPSPEEQNFMPDWPESERTHFQMYETTTEGTPISPVMETPEALAHWLADNNTSFFGNLGASYEQWLATIKRGLTMIAILVGGKGLVSGVEGLNNEEK